MFSVSILLVASAVTLTYGTSFDPISMDAFLRNQNLLDALEAEQEMLSNYNNDGQVDTAADEEQEARDAIFSNPNIFSSNNNNNNGVSEKDSNNLNLSIRDRELIQHSSSPWGHQYVQGGAGEGDQRLKPDGSQHNVQVIKSDSVLPAYCDPPNPCPIGYSSDEFDCLDTFTNSAAFSREYQSSQECMCDQEHMFDCPPMAQTSSGQQSRSSSSTSNNDHNEMNDDDTELDTIARTLANNGDLRSFVGVSDKRAHLLVDADHRVVAKKFFTNEDHIEHLNQLKDQSSHAYMTKVKKNGNGSNGSKFWVGERTPLVISKKSPQIM